jgi:hypothetical protein
MQENNIKVNIERMLIVFVLAVVLVFEIISDSTLLHMYAYTLSFAKIVLLGFYIYLFKNKIYQMIAGGILVGLLSSFIETQVIMNIPFLLWVGLMSLMVFGGIVLIQSIKDSMQYGGFELLSFLLGFFLLLLPVPVAMLGEDMKELYLLNNFGLCFIIGTLMYNDNLWERYQYDQKKMIIYLLVTSLTVIITLSIKQLL